MKTLHSYLLREIVASLLVTLAVFTFVMLFGNVVTDLLPLMAQGAVNFWTVLKIVGLLVPFVLVFALPMALLASVLLVFGRFSADNELTAARAGGVSLLSLVTPVLTLSLLLCALSAFVNMTLAPRCRTAYTDIRNDIRSALFNVKLPEGRFIKDFPGYIFFIEQNRDNELKNVTVFLLDNDSNAPSTTIRAPRGRVVPDKAANVLNVELYDLKYIFIAEGKALPGRSSTLNIKLDLNSPASKKKSVSITDMSFDELRAEMRDLESRLTFPGATAGGTNAVAVLTPRDLETQRRQLVTPLLVQMHRQVAFSFACFGFALIGIPLGIRVHRRETNIGFGIALLLVFVYYCFMLVAKGLAAKPELHPHLWMWIPNFLFQGLGAVMLWRANRGL